MPGTPSPLKLGFHSNPYSQVKGPHQEQSTELLKGQVTFSDKSLNVPPPFTGDGFDVQFVLTLTQW
jgi:hypothetical protein